MLEVTKPEGVTAECSQPSTSSPFFNKIAIKQQDIPSFITRILSKEPTQNFTPEFSSPFLERLKIQQNNSLNDISNLILLSPSPESKEIADQKIPKIPKNNYIEWLKEKGYVSLAEKMEANHGYPWNEFEKIRSPILLEQLVDLHLICVHKQIPKSDALLLTHFSLYLANLVDSSCSINGVILNDVKHLLGQIIYLTNLDPNQVIQSIDLSNHQSTFEKIGNAFNFSIQQICERLHDHYAVHQETQLQDAKLALHTRIPYEIAKGLLTEIGTINFGIIDTFTNIFLPTDEIPINHEINLAHSLTLLQRSPKLRSEFEKINFPQIPKSPSNEVIQVAIGLPLNQSIGNYETRLTALTALLSHLRQGEDRSCFAVSLAIEILSSHLNLCFKDLRELLEEGKLTRTVKGVKKQIPFAKKINDDNLNKIIVFNQKGDIFAENVKKLPLWEAPGLITACQFMGINHPREAILELIAQLPQPKKEEKFQIKIKDLIQKLCKQAAKTNSSFTLDQTYTLALFAFSAQTAQPLLKVWENAIANMAEAEEGSMIKNAILGSTLDALQLKLGELKIPPSPLLQRLFHYIKKLICERFHLQYDPTKLHSIDRHGQVSEGAFVLYHQNQKIEDEQSFLNAIRQILDEAKALMFKKNLSDSNKEELQQVFDIFNSEIGNPRFLGYLLARYHYSNKPHAKKMAKGFQVNFEELSFTPWITHVGNNSKALLSIYFEQDQPFQTEKFVSMEAEGTLSKIIDICKKMPDSEKDLYLKNPNKLKPLCILGKHRLPFMAGNPSLVKAWKQDDSTQNWIKNTVTTPGKQISSMIIDTATKSNLLQNMEKDILPKFFSPKQLAEVMKNCKQLSNKHTIKQYRDLLIKICQNIYPHANANKKNLLIRQIDTALCNSLEPNLKKKLEDSAVHFADTNWCSGTQDLHFCFAVNPGTGNLELWEVHANGSHLMALDQNYWLHKQEWEFLTLPDNLIPDDSQYLI